MEEGEGGWRMVGGEERGGVAAGWSGGLMLKCLIDSLPKDVFGKCHAFHQGNRRQVDAVCDIANSIYAGYGCLIEAIHLDLALRPQLNTNLHPSMPINAMSGCQHTLSAISFTALLESV